MKIPAKLAVLAACGSAALACAPAALILWALVGGPVIPSERIPAVSPQLVTAPASTRPEVASSVAKFHATIEPILQERCYQCHSGTDNLTPVAIDALKTDDSIANNPDLWLKVLRNTRSHIMPPVFI